MTALWIIVGGLVLSDARVGVILFQIVFVWMARTEAVDPAAADP